MINRSIKALLFSDMKGFTRMTERECVTFCQNFHSGVQRNVLAKYNDGIILKNTWGDALHVVLDDVVTAGQVALDLRDWVAEFDWIGAGMKSAPKIRIGLHAGVVTKIDDPITGECNFVGHNTSKAARIEPIAFEGQVFVSQPFTALLALRTDHNMTCEYVGMKALPKNAGTISVYLLNRIKDRQR